MAEAEDTTRRAGVGFWIAAIAGVLLALIGIALAGGGAWLAVLGGSWYYAIAGLLLPAPREGQ